MSDGHHHHMSNMSTSTMHPMDHMKMTTTMGHHGHGHGHGSPDMNGSMCMAPDMMMYFHTGTCEYILFEQIIVSNAAQMGGACVVVFFLAMMYEGLKCLREYLIQRNNVATKYYNATVPNSSSKETIIMEPNKSVSNKMLSGGHFLQTILHMLQVFVSYCLMLIFMTYNVYLCIAIILGAGAGYFFFGWRRAVVVDMNEHCH